MASGLTWWCRVVKVTERMQWLFSNRLAAKWRQRVGADVVDAPLFQQ